MPALYKPNAKQRKRKRKKRKPSTTCLAYEIKISSVNRVIMVTTHLFLLCYGFATLSTLPCYSACNGCLPLSSQDYLMNLLNECWVWSEFDCIEILLNFIRCFPCKGVFAYWNRVTELKLNFNSKRVRYKFVII